MRSLKVRTFKGGGTTPDTTITIPLAILRVASKLLPERATAALQEKGIDVEMIVELARNKDVKGTLAEIEEHKKNEKIIISIE
jgi:hypothetical protein